MTTKIQWRIPPSVLRWLKNISEDQSVAMLIRHSVRLDLPPGDAAYSLPITDKGSEIAEELGRHLGPRLRRLYTSPLVRCVQTAEAMASGSELDRHIHHDRMLGDPGAFVLDGKRAWSNWQQRGHEGVMSHLVSADKPLPGMADPDSAARFLVHHMLAACDGVPGIHAFVTHDSLITAAAARLLGEPLGTDDWPWYLEAAFFWKKDGVFHTAYRDYHGERHVDHLCDLHERDVIDFARREIALTVGLDCPARFFLAGGAFKTLLSGRSVRDLDFWAPSVQDRDALVASLKDRGAIFLKSLEFGDTYEIAGRIVEIPRKTVPTTLEERLQRFDIALSAIGVEHHGGQGHRAVIHPLAQESLKRKQVLLLKPLVNWKYALATLERMRRYSEELGFVIPEDEVTEVWRVFDTQSHEMQLGMVDRYDRTTHGIQGIREEALCRLQ